MSLKNETMLTKRLRGGLARTFPGSFSTKYHGGQYGLAGMPDILCCINGIFVGIECKVKPGRPSDNQLTVMRAINRAGGLSMMIIGQKGSDDYWWVNVTEDRGFSYRDSKLWPVYGSVRLSKKTIVCDCDHLEMAIIRRKNK